MPSSQQLAAVSVKGYRELLRKFNKQSNTEESSVLFQHARERVLAHLRTNRRIHESANPQRAFLRFRQRLLDVQLSVQQLKQLRKEKQEKLRTAYRAAKAEGLPGAQRALFGKPRPEEVAVLGTDGFLRALVTGTVGIACKVFMQGMNSTQVEGAEVLQAALSRPDGQALITVSNHVASMDDPLVLAAILPMDSILQPKQLRWTLCATDRCFKHDLLVPFFRAGKVLPVERGAGVDQPGMRAAYGRLNAGEWVHIFPEGTRSKDGSMGRIRKGVGHLITACEKPPVVVPFVHSGMEKVIPRGSGIPRPGQEVKVLVGQPVALTDLLETAKVQGWEPDRLALEIATRVGERLHALKAELDGLPVPTTPPALDSDGLLPLIEDELESMHNTWGSELRNRLGVASLSSRVQASADRLQSSMQAALVGTAADGSLLHQSLNMLRGSRRLAVDLPDRRSSALEASLAYFRARTAAVQQIVYA